VRDGIVSRRAWSAAAWLIPAAFLGLPNCTFHRPVDGLVPNLIRGPQPRNGAIFCDIEQPLQRHCSTAEERAVGIPFSNAAVALNARDSSTLGLDDSPEALARCGGEPEAVVFRCAFPEGCPVCLNCMKVVGPAPLPHADPTAVCVAQCEDFFGQVVDDVFVPDSPPGPGVADFCQKHARVSTNAPLDDCLGGICTAEGSVDPRFDSVAHPEAVDPRRVAQPVRWQIDPALLAVSGFFKNTITRTAATSTPPQFDVSAVSAQVISGGHAFLEFTAGTTPGAPTLTERAAGFATGTPAPSLGDIAFGLDATNGGNLHLVENGQVTTFLTSYAPGDRFRVAIEGEGLRVYRNGALLLTRSAALPYPLRIVSSFIEKGAVLEDVRLVSIR
jgi:hypothetical protein